MDWTGRNGAWKESWEETTVSRRGMMVGWTSEGAVGMGRSR